MSVDVTINIDDETGFMLRQEISGRARRQGLSLMAPPRKSQTYLSLPAKILSDRYGAQCVDFSLEGAALTSATFRFPDRETAVLWKMRLE